MKKIKFFIVIIFAVCSFTACKKAEFQLYDSPNYIQFVKLVTDSTATSFLSTPNIDAFEFPIPVELVGSPANKETSFRIEVIDSLTSAPSSNYSIPGVFSFGANAVKDTAWITIKKTDAIAVAPVRLFLKLVPSEDFLVGQTERSFAIINISNVISQPQWWNSTVTGRFLGEYSHKKYRLFIEVTGQSDVNSADLNEIRAYTILFKNYLLQEKDAGRTVYEENNSEMKVALIGG